jgi:hypothetical protein
VRVASDLLSPLAGEGRDGVRTHRAPGKIPAPLCLTSSSLSSAPRGAWRRDEAFPVPHHNIEGREQARHA